MDVPEPRALLFDLGGVLIDIDFGRALATWAPFSRLAPDALRQAFRVDEAYCRHERGEIEGEAYFRHLCKVLELDATPAQVATGWNSIFVGEITATRRLVELARRRVPCFAFSNTNATHMACWTDRFPEVAAAFDALFVSHHMGVRKPEPVAFARVCHSIGLDPAAVLFFDDLLENVKAARAFGLDAVLVRSADDVAATLRERLHLL